MLQRRAGGQGFKRSTFCFIKALSPGMTPSWEASHAVQERPEESKGQASIMCHESLANRGKTRSFALLLVGFLSCIHGYVLTVCILNFLKPFCHLKSR